MTSIDDETVITRFWTNLPNAIKLAEKHGFEITEDEKGTKRTGRRAVFIITKSMRQAHVMYSELDKAPVK